MAKNFVTLIRIGNGNLKRQFLKNLRYKVRQNYGNQGLMERYKFNSLSAIDLTRG